jgi:hypothetical protein
MTPRLRLLFLSFRQFTTRVPSSPSLFLFLISRTAALIYLQNAYTVYGPGSLPLIVTHSQKSNGGSVSSKQTTGLCAMHLPTAPK